MKKFDVIKSVLIANGYEAYEEMVYGESTIGCRHKNHGRMMATVTREGVRFGVSVTGGRHRVNGAAELAVELNAAVALAGMLNNILDYVGPELN